MKGFFIAAPASILGSALVFVVLRLLFTERLRAWSSQNQKWQALESVVVSFYLLQATERITKLYILESEGTPTYHSHSDITIPAMGVLELSLRSEF